MRGERVILDADLADFYGVATKRLNEQVTRNPRRFPADFGFRLTKLEKAELVAKCDRSRLSAGEKAEVVTKCDHLGSEEIPRVPGGVHDRAGQGADLLIRATARLAKLLRVRLEEIPLDPVEGSWFANLLWYNRRKFVLFTHSPTLYSVLLADVTASDLRPLRPAFLPSLRQALIRDGLGSSYNQLVREPDSEQLAKTNSRSVLGSMNETAFLLEGFVMKQAESGRLDALTLTGEINGWVSLTLPETYPRDQLRAWLAAQSG